MKKTVFLIVGFFLLQGIIHNLGHPVTPAFVRGLGIPDFMFGVFFASMSFGLMIGGPIWGILSDQGQKKKYIILGLLIYSLGQFLFGYSHYASLMVLVRFISGLGVVSSSTLMTSHVIEISDVRDRAKHLAYLGAAFTVGASLGYFIGGFLATNELMITFLGTTDLRRIFLIQAIANTLYVGFIFLSFKEEKNLNVTIKKPSILKGFKQISSVQPTLLVFLVSLTFMTIGSTNLSKYIDVYFNELGYNSQQLGTFVMVTGFVSLFASIFLVPLFANSRKLLSTISIIQILSAVIIFFTFRVSNFILIMYTVFLLYVIFKTIYQPLEQNFISKHAKGDKYGGVMGLRQSFVSIGMVVGSLVGGFIYQIKPLLLFDSSAIVFLVGVLLLVLVHWMKKTVLMMIVFGFNQT
ncbi:MAG: MFS transporter [Acholeplasmataceae bacterium]|nr:MFS transporter [Acholeplasmataceae bacterium]